MAGNPYTFVLARYAVYDRFGRLAFRIGVAVADNPTGPFRDMNGGPLFDLGYPIIDANLHFDDKTGRVYRCL